METIPALELPVQLFVAGTAVGITIAIVEYWRTGDLTTWPLIVGWFAPLGFLVGFALAAIQ